MTPDKTSLQFARLGLARGLMRLAAWIVAAVRAVLHTR